MNPNIRYRLKSQFTGQILVSTLTLEEVEQGKLKCPFPWQILSRDLGTGLKDENGVKEIFNRDRVAKDFTAFDDPAHGMYKIEGTVEYSGGAFWIIWDDQEEVNDYLRDEIVEIIGTVYDEN